MCCGPAWERHVGGPSGVRQNREQRCQNPVERGRGEVNLSPGVYGMGRDIEREPSIRLMTLKGRRIKRFGEHRFGVL